MMIDPMPTIGFQCPVCGNYYYASRYLSGNTFGARRYTDGTMDAPMLPRNLWATKCPKCKTYFEKRFLRWMKNPIRLSPRFSIDETLKEMLQTAGEMDKRFDHATEEASFWEEILTQGVYVPSYMDPEEKKNYAFHIKRRILQSLWHCYNRDRNAFDDEKYNDICKQYMAFLDLFDEEDRIQMAELYRNIGEFEKSADLLQSHDFSEKFIPYRDCILAQIEKGNKNTAMLPPEKFGGESIRR